MLTLLIQSLKTKGGEDTLSRKNPKSIEYKEIWYIFEIALITHTIWFIYVYISVIRDQETTLYFKLSSES